jgi:hypothetical protein
MFGNVPAPRAAAFGLRALHPERGRGLASTGMRARIVSLHPRTRIESHEEMPT